MSKHSWLNPPPVSFLSGGEGFYVRREVQNAISKCCLTGRKVVHLTDSDAVLSEIEAALDAAALFSDPQMFIVHAPLALPIDRVKQHVEEGDNTVSLLLVHAGDLNAEVAKIQAVVPPKSRADYPSPKPWEEDKRAVGFLVRELQNRGLILPEPLAQALVGQAGTDLGVLWFEVLKICTYRTALGVTGDTVTPDLVKPVMLSFREMNPSPIVDALATGSVSKVLRATDHVRKNFSADPTMLTVAFLGNQIQKWLHAAVLDAQQASESEALKRLDVKAYPYKNSILPAARLWKVKPLMQLLQRVAQVEVAVKRGWLNPWVLLEGSLATSCLELASAPR